ncbi:MAG: hypothetical protein NXI13_07720 [Proteobacteria bacterium]|nr:hypothetical protein [Pseudomonadota bacterium]
MAKLNDPSSMKPVIVPCPNCNEPFEIAFSKPPAPCAHCGYDIVKVKLQPDPPSFYEEKIPDLEALVNAKIREKELEVDEDKLQAAMALYRRNAGDQEWAQANLDRQHWELKFKYMGLDDILARFAARKSS